MKKCWLLVPMALCFVIPLHAQFFLGLRGSPYGGITNVDYNPAIANSPFIADINLIGLGANINNNYVGMDRRVLFHPSLAGSANFQDNYLHERINGRYKYAYAGAQLQGPLSFMFSFGPRKNRSLNAIAVSWHSNVVLNGDHINETFARIAYFGVDSRAQAATQFLGRTLSNQNLSFKGAMWNDFGVTYSRVVYDKGDNLIKVGGTLKLLQPIAGAYMTVKNLSYQWPEYNTLSIFKSTVSYAYSAGLITSKGYSASDVTKALTGYVNDRLSYKNSVPTAAVDLGVVYEWRPDKNNYVYEMNCNEEWTYQYVPYKLAAGFSIIDFGALRFKRGDYSESFYADIRNWSVGNASFPDGLQSLDDTIRRHFQMLQADKKYFTIWLPTRFNAYVDYRVIDNFFVMFSAMISPDMSPKHTMIHQVSTFTITPKYEHRWFGIYTPLSYDVNGNISLGATIRVGPLIVGTQDLLALFAKRYVYNADIHAALKITIPHYKVHRKYDIRFIKKT